MMKRRRSKLKDIAVLVLTADVIWADVRTSYIFSIMMT